MSFNPYNYLCVAQKTGIPKNAIRKAAAGLLITCMLTVGLLLITQPYTLTLVDTKFLGDKLKYTFADLNGDGVTERIEIHKYIEGRSSLLIKHDEQVIDQWNFDGDIIYSSRQMVHDYDQDGQAEIFVFTQLRDSLYFHCIDAFSRKTEFRDVPVCQLVPVMGKYSYIIEPVDFIDRGHDGLPEILFAINTGFAVHPRAVYSYLPARDTVISSPESFTVLSYFNKADLDGDGIPEYVASSQASGNCDPQVPYSDMYAWLMVLQSDLTFKFEPRKTGSYPSRTSLIPFQWKNEMAILAMHNYNGSGDEDNYLALFDKTGSLSKKRVVRDPDILRRSYLIPNHQLPHKPLLLNEGGTLYSIDKELQLHKIKQLKNTKIQYPVYLDIDHDRKDELVLLNEDNLGLTVFRSLFRHPASIRLPDSPALPYFSLVHDRKHTNGLSVCLEKQHLLFHYHRTWAHRFWYLFAVVIFLLVMAISLLIRKLTEFSEMKRSQARNGLAELQMRSIQNQLDPHFTFNVIQSFGALLNESDTARANFVFEKYADMLKTTVLNSDKILVTLDEELGFVESYLSLEQFRQQDHFTHQVEISEGIDKNMLIPKMLIHIFVENAVKHGLRHRGPGGRLLISVGKDNGFVKITVTDNGIGRKEAATRTRFSTGKGFGILDQIIELYQLLHRSQIKYYIIDLKDGEKAAGTKIEIYIRANPWLRMSAE